MASSLVIRLPQQAPVAGLPAQASGAGLPASPAADAYATVQVRICADNVCSLQVGKTDAA